MNQKIYILIDRNSLLVGIFSSKRQMKAVCEALIKDDYENTGVYGDYHFRYAEFPLNAPWVEGTTKDMLSETKAMMSLFTHHREYFKHKIVNDFSTGKILEI